MNLPGAFTERRGPEFHTLEDYAHHALKQAILSQQLAPGEEVTLQSLEEALGVSRHPDPAGGSPAGGKRVHRDAAAHDDARAPTSPRHASCIGSGARSRPSPSRRRSSAGPTRTSRCSKRRSARPNGRTRPRSRGRSSPRTARCTGVCTRRARCRSCSASSRISQTARAVPLDRDRGALDGFGIEASAS